MTGESRFPPGFLEGVRALVQLIPEGRAMSYGAVAEAVGFGGPRQSAAAMASGLLHDVPWWRVVRADGGMTGPLRARARAAWQAEATPLAGVRKDRVDMPKAAWRPGESALRAVDAAIEEADAGASA